VSGGYSQRVEEGSSVVAAAAMPSMPFTLAMFACLGAANSHVFLAYQAEDSELDYEMSRSAAPSKEVGREDRGQDPWIEVVITTQTKETDSVLFQTCFDEERKVWAQFYYWTNLYERPSVQYVRYANNDTSVSYSWWETSDRVLNILDCAELMALKNYKTWVYLTSFFGWTRHCRGSNYQATLNVEECTTTGYQPYFVQVK